jgi:UDP-N-acetylmuramoyl-L-alanyl-D-glutamate--2,6-diaminopimelate ligase
MYTMPLRELVEPLLLKSVEGNAAGEVTGFADHSDRVRPGNLFLALSGRQTEGWRHARQALDRGALAVIAGGECPLKALPLLRVPDVRLAAALLANRFYGYPSRKLRLVGVTGTNGKTTTTHMIDALFKSRGETTGLLGTVGYWIGRQRLPATATTPEAAVLQTLLARLVEIGAGRVTMEVSSHALAQHRVAGCRFAVAVMTNITGEHIDFHRSFEAYLEAKIKLFAQLGWDDDHGGGPRAAVLNVDDPCYRQVERMSAGQKITYGIDQPADVRAVELQEKPGGIRFKLESFAGQRQFELPVPGRFNVYNALAATAVGLIEGIELDAIAEALACFRGVPGRFELVDAGQDFTVVVDYAHTPDGLENVIRTARGLTGGRVITVFGCGGERDRSKRILMGEAAGRYSDLAILTDDNPRGEDPVAIVREVEPGLKSNPPAEGYRIIHDRKEAIAAAVQAARRGDLILIAGKGHEAEQVYRNRVIPFSDRQVVKDLITAAIQGRNKCECDDRFRAGGGMPRANHPGESGSGDLRFSN